MSDFSVSRPRGRQSARRNPLTGRFTSSSGVQWYYDSLTPNLVALGPKLVSALAATLEFTAAEMESYMRSHAPWTDRTGNARNGLFARRFGDGMEQGIDLFHTVSYGLWLEVRWDGKYAIILPTIQHFNSMESVSDILREAVG